MGPRQMFNFNKAFAVLQAISTIVTTAPAFAQHWKPDQQNYEFNRGADPSTPEGKLAIKLQMMTPEHKYVSDSLMDRQKFRFAWGPTVLRINYAKNSMKVIAQGQDAVDDAELVHLPGTGTGYSTRTQSIFNHLGIDAGGGTTNAYAQTIRAQYGDFHHPMVVFNPETGKGEIKLIKFVNNHLWNMTHGPHSPLKEYSIEKNEVLIKNNPDSLALFILLGGASQDAWADLLIDMGLRVPTRYPEEKLKYTQLPFSTNVFGGGNNEFPVLKTKEGKDIYEILVGRPLDYTKPSEQKLAHNSLLANQEKAISLMFFEGGGLYNSGIIHPGQLDGGYDVTKAEALIGGKWTRVNHLQGQKLRDGTLINRPIAFVASPHPTVLSKKTPDEASRVVEGVFAGLRTIPNFNIEPDLDANGKPLVSNFAKKIPYQYGRAAIPRRVVPFGTPDSIRLPETSADRIGPQVIVSEPPSREEIKAAGFSNLEDLFDKTELERAKKALPAEPLDPREVWNAPPRLEATASLADRGPSDKIADLMVKTLDQSIFEPKAGMKAIVKRGREMVDVTFEKYGVTAYDIKSYPKMGDFANYRGTFENPRALILHDPMDLDDRNTYVAASGERGQNLMGLMKDLGIGMDHLVLKTVPVDMNGANNEEWERVRKKTEKYREALIKETVSTRKVEVLFADGPVAQYEIQRIVKKMKLNIPVINIPRDGHNAAAGIVEAGAEAKQLAMFRGATISGRRAAIPRQHLPWLIRTSEGNIAGTVVEAKGIFAGKVYAVVVPDVVANQKVIPLPETERLVRRSLEYIDEMQVRRPGESPSNFEKRTGRKGAYEPLALKEAKSKVSTGQRGIFESQTKISSAVQSCQGLFK